MASLFKLSVVCWNLVLGSPTSTGIKASASYTREKGVSPVLDFEVVRYAHSTSGNISLHFPLALSSFFSLFWMMVLFLDSAWLFAHQW